MCDIVHTLTTDEVPSKVDTSDSEGLSIFCLGTGKGVTALIHGEPSSSFVVLKDKKPVLLIDLGLGVTSSYRQYMDKEMNFDHIYITHNHADHAAELPVVLAALKSLRAPKQDAKQKLPVVLAAPEVMHRLCTFRLNEVCSENKVENFAEWRTCEKYPNTTDVDSESEFQLTCLLSQHTEICYGFLLYHRKQLLIGFTGDSGFNPKLYERVFSAPNVIVDARTESSKEHAGFAEVEEYVGAHKNEDQRIFVTGYGVDSEYPENGVSGCIQLRTGQEYALRKAVATVLRTPTTRTNVTAEYTTPLQGVL